MFGKLIARDGVGGVGTDWPVLWDGSRAFYMVGTWKHLGPSL